jgi:hypothetical protein
MEKRIITVREPCTCGARRWFMCRCADEIARYECHTDFDGMAGVVHPTDVAAVAALHPGKDLIYNGPPPWAHLAETP